MDETKILDVPAMWYGNPSAVCFIGSVIRLMDYIGDPVEQDELFALSGAGLCFPWLYASSCDEVSVIPEIPARTFEALGYSSEYLTGEDIKDKNVCLDRIKQSIGRGHPVVGFGITVSMPMSCLIVGYDGDGLYTRSFWPPNGERHDSPDCFYSRDWYENCSGLLIVGEKTGERLTGAAAYARVTDWALRFRCCARSVKAEGKDIYLNQYAFDEMIRWLLDDTQWENPNEGGREQFLKQCGLLLLNHYRWQLYEYLKRLDTKYPEVVNKSVFTALERIMNAVPGAHTSDLWLHEAVDPALADFGAMKDRALREKLAGYVRLLKGYDDSVQWTLFMPESVKAQQKGFKVDSFEYRSLPAMRFIGAEGEEYDDIPRRMELMARLDELSDYKSGFDYDILFMHHYGLTADNPWHGVWGRFMRADTPVPEGMLSFEFVPQVIPFLQHDVPVAGAPYYSRFAYATFSGDTQAMHSREGFDSDAMYDVTRNIVLGDGVNIPYPEKYWTAEVFHEGCDKHSSGFLFSVSEWQGIK